MKTKGYQPRAYRTICQSCDLTSFRVTVAESDLFIRAHEDLSEKAIEILADCRKDVEGYVTEDRMFLDSLVPIKVLDNAPAIIKEMAEASSLFGVGPMGAVAGAIAEKVARHLFQFSDEIIVENGGDIFVINKKYITTAIYAGNSPLSMKLGIELPPHPEGISICTSSGTVGHSLSFGKADAVVIISPSGSIADAAATAVCNIVQTENDIESAITFAQKFKEISGVVIIIKDKIGFVGESFKLVELD